MISGASMQAAPGLSLKTKKGWASLFLLLLGLGQAQAQFYYYESFSGTSAPGWEFLQGGTSPGPRLTANATPAGTDPETGLTIDADGQGWLRLSSLTGFQANVVSLDTVIPSANNTVTIQFDFTAWNRNTGSGADGLAMFLWNANTAINPGADGGSLGYAQKTGINGLAGGYLGVGIDVFGNFQNATEGRTGSWTNYTTNNPGSKPNEVSVRGPGSGTSGYYVLGGTGSTNYTDPTLPAISSLGSTNLAFATYTTRPDQDQEDYRALRVVLSSSNTLTVSLKAGAANPFVDLFTLDVSMFTRPDQLRIGFSAATGGLHQVYEIRNLTISTSGLTGTSYWDNDTESLLWSGATNWAPNTIPTNYATVAFTDSYPNTLTNQTVVIDGGDKTLNSITFNGATSFTLQAQTTQKLILDTNGGGDSYITIANSPNGNADQTISADLQMNNTLRVQNLVSQTLTLNGNIANGGHLLRMNSFGTTLLNGQISGTGSLFKTGSGTAVLSGSNSYTGTTTVAEGTLRITHGSALGTSAGGTTVSNGASLALASNITVASEPLTLYGAGDGGRGALYSATGTNQWNGNITLATNTSLGAETGASLRVNGVISGSGQNLTKVGAGTLVLAATNTYTGTTTLQNGTLILNASSPNAANGSLGNASSTVQIGSSSTLSTDHLALLLGPDGTTLGRSINVTNAGASVTLGGTNTSGTNTFSGAITLNRSANLYASNGGTVVFSGALNGSTNGITKTGTGTIILSGTGANTLSGSNTIQSGTLILNKTAGVNALSGSILVGDGSGGAGADILRLANSNQIDDSARLHIASSGSFQLNNFSETIGGLSGDSGSQITLGSGTLTVSQTNTSTFAGVISGTGGLTKTNTGNLILSGTNTFTGPLTIGQGTLTIGTANALADTVDVTMTGGTLAVTGVADSLRTNTINSASSLDFLGQAGGYLTFSNLAGSGSLTVNNWIGSLSGNGNTRFIVNTNAIALSTNNITFAGWGTGSQLINLGGGLYEIVPLLSGAFEWDGSNDNSWTTGANWTNNTAPNAIDAVTLFRDLDTGDRIVEIPATGGSTRTNGTLILNSTNGGYLIQSSANNTVRTLAFDVSSGSAYITVAGSDAHRIGGSNRPIDIDMNDALIINNNSSAGIGLTIGFGTNTGEDIENNGNTLTFSGSGTTVVNSLIYETGGLVKSDGGTVRLNNANTYSGGTTLNAGTIQLGTNNALGSGTVTINGGAFEAFGAARSLTNALTINNSFAINGTNDLTFNRTGTSTLASNATITVTNGINATFSATHSLGGSGTLTKDGAGTLTLLATNNTYTGGIVVNAGTLQTTNVGTTTLGGTGTGTYFGTGTNLTVNGGTLLVSSTSNNAITIASGGTVQVNGGLFAVTNNNAGTSADFNLNGTLRVDGGAASINTGDDINLAGGSRLILTSGSSTFSAGGTIVTAGTATTNRAEILVSGTAQAQFNLTTNGGDGNEFTLSRFDVLQVTGTNAQVTINGETNSTINLTGQVNLFNGGQLTVAQGTALINSNTVLNGGTNAAKGTLNLYGNLQVGASNQLANAPNITLYVTNATSTNTITSTTGTNSITGIGTLTKNGPGTTLIAASINNIDANRVVVNAGTLLIGNNERIANSADLDLAGGRFATGGFSETLDTLTLSANSVIDMGSGNSFLTFNSVATWDPNATLNILNWSGLTTGGGTDRIRFVNDPTDVIGAGIANITFDGYYKAKIVQFGGYYEIVPIPETENILAAFALALLLAWRERRRLHSWLAALRSRA
jgi:autotransporter-associated beta strand protein